MMALMYSPSPVAARRYGSVIVPPDCVLSQEYLPCGIQKRRRLVMLSTMVSLAPTLPHGLPAASVIVSDCEIDSVLYLNLVLVREVGIAVNVDEGLAPSVLASEVKRIEERGIFKAHLTQTPV